MTMSIDDCEVLIVGAGPVGLLLGLMLHARGINVKLVERQRAMYPLPRAVALDHEARRLLGSVNLSEELEPCLQKVVNSIKGGEDTTNYVWRDADLKLVVDLFSELPTRSGFDSQAGFNQPQLESVLDKAATERNLPLLRGYGVTALEARGDKVAVSLHTVKPKQGTTLEERDCANIVDPTAADRAPDRVITASYVVGCDGANSTVRRLMEFTTTDLNFENDWLVIDILLRDGYVPPLVARVGACQICDPNRPTTCVFGGPGRKRFEFMRLKHESKEEILQEGKIWELLAPWGWTKDNCDLERKVIYTFRARWANEFYKGRVLLAGDALHLMPPFMGQGLNSGFRDAAGLAWRLPLMLSGLVNSDALLRSYQEERLEHVRKLTVDCIKLGEVVCETDPAKSKAMHEALRKNPLPHLYNPRLGLPGTLTTQEEAGRLALQRRLKVLEEGQPPLFDEVHGYGWRLLNMGDSSLESQLSEKSLKFLTNVLKGKCVSVSTAEDYEGEYRAWFEQMGQDHAVLIRPDFYVFGHAAASDVDALLHDLRTQIGAA